MRVSVVVTLLVAMTSCTSDGERSADERRPALKPSDEVGEWFVLEAPGWRATLGQPDPAPMPVLNDIWFANYEKDLDPEARAAGKSFRTLTVVLGMHDTRGRSLAEFVGAIPSGAPIVRTEVRGHEGYFGAYNGERPGEGGFFYWSVGPGRVLSLGGSEITRADLEKLLDAVVPVADKAEWMAKTNPRPEPPPPPFGPEPPLEAPHEELERP